MEEPIENTQEETEEVIKNIEDAVYYLDQLGLYALYDLNFNGPNEDFENELANLLHTYLTVHGTGVMRKFSEHYKEYFENNDADHEHRRIGKEYDDRLINLSIKFADDVDIVNHEHDHDQRLD